MTTITVFHNVTPDERGNPMKGMLDGYAHGDTVTAVFTTTTGRADDMATLEDMWRLLNVGDDPDFGTPDPRAVEYRARGNRSLSMGDVVAIGPSWYACARAGWTRVIEPARVSYEATPGTTSIEDAAAPRTAR